MLIWNASALALSVASAVSARVALALVLSGNLFFAGRMLASPTVFEDQTVAENLTMALAAPRAVVELDAGYKAAYRFMQRKWRASLPIPNLVCPITRSPFTLWLQDLRIRRKHGGRPRPPEPTDDPSIIARRLGIEDAPTR